MAEESDLEKTESATSRRVEKAREEGNVPRSRELMAFMVLISGVGGCWALGDWLSSRTVNLLRHGLIVSHEAAFDTEFLFSGLYYQSSEALITLAPLLLLTVVATFAAPMMIGGWNVSFDAIGFNFGKMNPIEGIKRMFSMSGVAELVKASLKAMVVGYVIYWVVSTKQLELFSMFSMSIHDGIPMFIHSLMIYTLLIVGGVAIIAAIDVPFQLWQYYFKLRMTLQEQRDEGKETDGNPEMKGQQRRRQRETAKRRMMEEVPKADVVVTNPTHYAVALKYDSSRMGAPTVVAKGMNLVAANIRELAIEHGVPLLEAPPLARALYRHAKEGEQVPSALYAAVAEVMAYVYQLSAFLTGSQPGMLPPVVPEEIIVPAELDPGVPREVIA